MKIYEFIQRDIVTSNNNKLSSAYIQENNEQPRLSDLLNTNKQPDTSRRKFLGGLAKAAVAGATAGGTAMMFAPDNSITQLRKEWKKQEEKEEEVKQNSPFRDHFFGYQQHPEVAYIGWYNSKGRQLQGIYNWRNELQYIGNFDDDVPSGFGKLMGRDLQSQKFLPLLQGDFENGKIIGKAKYSSYFIDFINNNRHVPMEIPVISTDRIEAAGIAPNTTQDNDFASFLIKQRLRITVEQWNSLFHPGFSDDFPILVCS